MIGMPLSLLSGIIFENVCFSYPSRPDEQVLKVPTFPLHLLCHTITHHTITHHTITHHHHSVTLSLSHTITYHTITQHTHSVTLSLSHTLTLSHTNSLYSGSTHVQPHTLTPSHPPILTGCEFHGAPRAGGSTGRPLRRRKVHHRETHRTLLRTLKWKSAPG